ncbi:MAG: GMC family oxidoreductase [Candidatus Omnitrophica bacterium]|nr:GMC family oxidoreductase [Candidatus Omnitrophota bacterium]
MIKTLETEIVIVGSGPAGATLAKELSKRRKKVVLIERGRREIKLGRMKDGLRFYEKHTFQKSKEGTVLYGTNMVGGTSVVASGNALRCSQKELLDLGIELENDFLEAERELKAAPLPDKCISEGARKILESAQALGLQPKRIPKFINPEKCKICGYCVMGCRYNAKWSAMNYVDEAVKDGAALITQTKAIKVLTAGGKAQGIEAAGPDGPIKIMSDIVIISAGGIQTPIILQKSGIINAGKRLFCDPWMTTYGITKNLNQVKGVNAPGYVLKPQRFILFPVIDPPVQFLLYTGRRSLFGRFPRQKALGMMTKIADEPVGKVHLNGCIEKPITSKDKEKFKEGNRLVKEILIKAGADPKSILTIKQIRGPHPGGTAAIGEVVNNNLETAVKNLFVCDNSVLPEAPGLPPILTIIALSKWLSKKIASI